MLIDAHADGIRTVGIDANPKNNLAYVFGTSSCTMTSTSEPVFVPGVWGPYYQAMVPGMWLNEGGQSAAGAAIDQLLSFHPAATEATEAAQADGQPLAAWLAKRAIDASADLSQAITLADGLHVVPEFMGNRAPFADPHARALIAGLGMARDIDSLTALYIAGISGIGYGLRQIIETQNRAGAPVQRIVISGGAGQSDLIRQLLADAVDLPVVSVTATEPVLLGSAILGAVAAGAFASLPEAMEAMSHVSTEYPPVSGSLRRLHDRRYTTFCKLQDVYRSCALRDKQAG